jgi:chloramphenicol-sensitive protein RarD
LLAWLLLSGFITTIPLLAFAEAAKTLPLTSMGFLQFLSPSLQFILGVFVYQEQFSPARWIPFCVIWAGLLVFLWDIALRSGFACRALPSRK